MARALPTTTIKYKPTKRTKRTKVGPNRPRRKGYRGQGSPR